MHTLYRVPPVCLVLILTIVFGAESASAVKPENGPEYLTDGHAAGGVVRSMLALGEVCPEYLKYADGTLQWIMSVAEKDDQGRIYWYQSVSAAKGHPNRKVKPGAMCMTTTLLFDACERTGREEFGRTADAAARWLLEVPSRREETSLGAAWSWPFTYHPSATKPTSFGGWASGYNYGVGKYVPVLVALHRQRPEKKYEDALRGIVLQCKIRAIDLGDGKIAWAAPELPNFTQNNVKICNGYCFGVAGTAMHLLELHEYMPDVKLEDGTSALDLANGALRYLMSEARPAKKGFRWPYMRNTRDSKTPGYGSGTGGIGLAFLKAYQLNRREGNDEFAEQCMRYSRGAAEYALFAVGTTKAGTPMADSGGTTGYGICGGAGGTAILPMELAKEIGQEDPEFMNRAGKAARHVALSVIASATEIDGTLAWIVSPGGRVSLGFRRDVEIVNMALDYGQTGNVLGLAETAKFLDDDEILDAAKKAADFIVKNIVKDDNGFKTPRIVHLKR